MTVREGVGELLAFYLMVTPKLPRNSGPSAGSYKPCQYRTVIVQTSRCLIINCRMNKINAVVCPTTPPLCCGFKINQSRPFGIQDKMKSDVRQSSWRLMLCLHSVVLRPPISVRQSHSLPQVDFVLDS